MRLLNGYFLMFVVQLVPKEFFIYFKNIFLCLLYHIGAEKNGSAKAEPRLGRAEPSPTENPARSRKPVHP
jgi:hypothetical protein